MQLDAEPPCTQFPEGAVEGNHAVPVSNSPEFKSGVLEVHPAVHFEFPAGLEVGFVPDRGALSTRNLWRLFLSPAVTGGTSRRARSRSRPAAMHPGMISEPTILTSTLLAERSPKDSRTSFGTFIWQSLATVAWPMPSSLPLPPWMSPPKGTISGMSSQGRHTLSYRGGCFRGAPSPISTAARELLGAPPTG